MKILVTGANRGIGLEMVKIAVSKRWHVFACCRNPHESTKLNEVASMSAGLVSVKILDVSDRAQIQALAYELRNDCIDILINNAGVYGESNGSLGDFEDDDWLNTFKINTIAPLRVAEAFVEHVACSQKKLIATMSSKMASMEDNTSGGSYVYRSSKAATNAVVKSLSLDLAPKGITCVALHPGWVKTDMGGPNAEITTRQCVTQLFDILENCSAKDTGKFIDVDGSVVPW